MCFVDFRFSIGQFVSFIAELKKLVQGLLVHMSVFLQLDDGPIQIALQLKSKVVRREIDDQQRNSTYMFGGDLFVLVQTIGWNANIILTLGAFIKLGRRRSDCLFRCTDRLKHKPYSVHSEVSLRTCPYCVFLRWFVRRCLCRSSATNISVLTELFTRAIYLQLFQLFLFTLQFPIQIIDDPIDR